MNELFDIVYKLLKAMANLTGLSYREINIIVYFIIIPSFLVYLVSRIVKKKSIILVFLFATGLVLLAIPDFKLFSDRLFDLSVDFLNGFEHIGLNYVQASVVICVILPVLIIAALLMISKKGTSNQ